MIVDFQKQQALKYFGKGKNVYEKIKHNQSNSLGTHPEKKCRFYEESSSYDFSAQQRLIEPLMIAEQNIQILLDISFEHHCILPDHETFYVMDISRFSASPFNTVIFQLNQAPLKTTEYSHTVMDRYFEHKGIPYDYIRLLGNSIGIKKCCPYVLGEEIFVPEKGALSSDLNTSWYGLHHVLRSEKNTKDGLTYLVCRNHHRLVLPIGKRSYQKQLNRAANLSYIQQLFINRMMHSFDLTVYSTPEKERNVVQQRLQLYATNFPDCFTFQDYFDYLNYFKTHEQLVLIFGDGDPYIEEIMDSFKLPPFPFKF